MQQLLGILAEMGRGEVVRAPGCSIDIQFRHLTNGIETLLFPNGTLTKIVLYHMLRLGYKPCDKQKTLEVSKRLDGLYVALGSPIVSGSIPKTLDEVQRLGLHDLEFPVYLQGEPQGNHHWSDWCGDYEFVVKHKSCQ